MYYVNRERYWEERDRNRSPSGCVYAAQDHDAERDQDNIGCKDEMRCDDRPPCQQRLCAALGVHVCVLVYTNKDTVLCASFRFVCVYRRPCTAGGVRLVVWCCAAALICNGIFFWYFHSVSRFFEGLRIIGRPGQSTEHSTARYTRPAEHLLPS